MKKGWNQNIDSTEKSESHPSHNCCGLLGSSKNVTFLIRIMTVGSYLFFTFSDYPHLKIYILGEFIDQFG